MDRQTTSVTEQESCKINTYRNYKLLGKTPLCKIKYVLGFYLYRAELLPLHVKLLLSEMVKLNKY